MDLVRRTAQQIVASYPSHIALDGREVGIDGFIIVQPGETGYWPAHRTCTSLEAVDELLSRVYGARKPTPAERQGASVGSMFGWDVPGADPLNNERD